jgi:phenylacetic acid degradation operon negative regulatory protein
VVVRRVKDRARRTRLRAGLGFLGYAPLDETVWISPRSAPELDALLDAEGVTAERFHSTYDGEQCDLVARAWDLDTLGTAYERWLDWARETVQDSGDLPAEQAFALRSTLVHEWRKFLFLDPGLPAAVLPQGWPGTVAAAFFDAESARLLPAAARFVDRCLDE